MISFGKAVVLSLCLAAPAFADDALTLMALDHVWRYEGSGADLGAVWRETAYDDSAWPQGRGVLAYEENPAVRPLINTVLTRTGTNGEYKVIDYFRTHFNLPEVRAHYVLAASMLVDDGAIVYLNGTELFRLRMPLGPVTASTLASDIIAVGGEGIFVNTNLVAPSLRAGDNVLAVEVHQPYLTSSDVTWGMILSYAPMEPVAIAVEPLDRVVAEGGMTTVAVSVTGTLPRFQWWRDGQPLAGQTNLVLSRTAISRSDAGQYFITVSNDISAVTSRVATLTVLLDREPPRLLSVDVSGSVFNLSFSELLDLDSVTKRANYRIVDSAGSVVPIDVNIYGFGSTVSFTNQPLRAGINHYLFVSNVRDRFGNVIAPDSGVAIPTVFTNLSLDAVWKYNDSGIALDAEWNQPGYDDSQWPSGPGLLYNDVNLTLRPPGVLGTRIQVTNSSGSFVTHYFRVHFTNDASPLGSSFEFSHYLDDGAVFYLNGREVHRFNMPFGTIGPLTRASSSAAEGAFNGSFLLKGTNVPFGENLLAVEVHQFSLTSPDYPDISFGLQCRARVESIMNTIPEVLLHPSDVTVLEGSVAVFRAGAAAAESVQWLRDGGPIPGATAMSYTNFVNSPWDSGTGFALVASNSFGSVTSRTARLIVIPDRAPPRLLSARMGTNVNQVIVSFSEPLDPFAAGVESYIITNTAGGGLEILDGQFLDASNVVLTTSPRTVGEHYVVVAYNIGDAAGNVFESAVLGIEYEQLLVGYDSVWRYDDTATNYSNAWREPAFDDSAWPSGPGLLGFEDSPFLPLPIRTMLPPPEYRGPTYFFRTHFNFSGDPAGAVLRLRHIIDDGLVLFLNGQETYRVRVPFGQNATTLADFAVNDGTLEGPFIISVNALISGDNALAAELHQNSGVSADAVFGIELVQAYQAHPATPIGPTLNYRWRDGQLLLSWDAWDFVLESALKLSGPWTLVTRPTIPYVVSPNDCARFFRLRKDS